MNAIQTRRQWAPKVQRGEVVCPACERVIAPGFPWVFEGGVPVHPQCATIPASSPRAQARTARPVGMRQPGEQWPGQSRGKPERNSRDW